MRGLATADIFNCLRLIKAADMKDELSAIIRNSKGKTQREVGIEFIYSIMIKCADKTVENAFYDLVCAPLELSSAEVAEMNPIKLMDALYDVAAPEEWIDFFNHVRALNQAKKK